MTDRQALGLRWFGGGLPVALTLLPLGALVLSLVNQGFAYLTDRQALVAGYTLTTLLVLVVTAVVALGLGTMAAWLIHWHQFPGRRAWMVVLSLPLAMPPYLAAYGWSGFLDLTGPLSILTQTLGGSEGFHVSPRGPLALGILLGFLLYPYVYLSVLPALSRGPGAALQAARTLGRHDWGLLASPGLALLRPFALAGTALAVMEALGEYGAAQYWGVETLTHGLFRSWYHAWDLGSAVLLGLLMATGALGLVGLERSSRGQQRYQEGRPSAASPLPPRRGLRAWGIPLALGLMVLPGLGIPLVQLLWWVFRHPQSPLPELLAALGGSLVLMMGAGVLALGLATMALVLTRSPRPLRPSWKPLAAVGSLAYAIPGAVLALGILLALSTGSPFVAPLGLGVLVLALGIRFHALAQGSLAAAWEHRVRPHAPGALILEGRWTLRALAIDLPLLAPALRTTAIMVAIDLAKELNATLLLRPLGFETIPSLLHRQAAMELPSQGALGGLLLIAFTGLLATLLQRKNRHA